MHTHGIPTPKPNRQNHEISGSGLDCEVALTLRWSIQEVLGLDIMVL